MNEEIKVAILKSDGSYEHELVNKSLRLTVNYGSRQYIKIKFNNGLFHISTEENMKIFPIAGNVIEIDARF